MVRYLIPYHYHLHDLLSEKNMGGAHEINLIAIIHILGLADSVQIINVIHAYITIHILNNAPGPIKVLRMLDSTQLECEK